MTNDDLVRVVRANKESTETELELAERLQAAMDEIVRLVSDMQRPAADREDDPRG